MFYIFWNQEPKQTGLKITVEKNTGDVFIITIK